MAHYQWMHLNTGQKELQEKGAAAPQGHRYKSPTSSQHSLDQERHRSGGTDIRSKKTKWGKMKQGTGKEATVQSEGWENIHLGPIQCSKFTNQHQEKRTNPHKHEEYDHRNSTQRVTRAQDQTGSPGAVGWECHPLHHQEGQTERERDANHKYLIKKKQLWKKT